MNALGEMGVEIARGMGVEIDSASVQQIIKSAMDLCENTYHIPIQSAIDKIKKRHDLIR